MNVPHRLKTVHPRHEDVDDEQVKAPRLEQLQSGVAVVDGFDCMGGALKQNLDGRKNRPIVIDDENARHGFP